MVKKDKKGNVNGIAFEQAYSVSRVESGYYTFKNLNA